MKNSNPNSNSFTLKQILDALSAGELSIDQLYDDLNQELDKRNTALNVFLTLNEHAREQSRQQYQQQKPLLGVPVAVKDNFCTKGLRTTAASKVLDNFIPPYDATVISKLKQAGGVCFGKVNMDAWAHGSSTETSDYGRTLNSRNPAHLPGGSSGGSAASVAADMAVIALGSETAGSIRQPSAWCGTVGLKPTYGRVSRYGVIAMASSTDSPGPIAKTVEDASILLNQIAGYDKLDSTTSPQPVPDFTKSLNQSIKGLKIGVLYQDVVGAEQANEQLIKQLDILRELGAKIENTQAMDPHYAIGVYTIVQRGEVSSNLARFQGITSGYDRSYFQAEAKRRIMLGTFTLSKGYADKYYDLAQKVRTMFLDDYRRLFAKYDVLVAPASPGFAKKVGASEESAMFGELEDMFLEPSSITGLPGISVPYYRDQQTNLYLGANFIAPMWQEEVIIKVADVFEKNTPGIVGGTDDKKITASDWHGDSFRT